MAATLSCWICLTATPSEAQERVDANIVTGLDVSSSFSASEVQNQIDYMIAAMQSQEVQGRIAHGRYGKVGFAVFVWSNQCAPIIEWRTVSTAEDLASVALNLQATTEAIRSAQGGGAYGGLTDTSNAMVCALEAFKNAPYKSSRKVLNIVTNGTDNVGPQLDKDPSTKLLLADAGITVNAMLMPGGFVPSVLEPFIECCVRTGGTSFSLWVDAPEKMIDAWIRKFIGDMV